MNKKFNVKLKKSAYLMLAGILSVSILASCGAKKSTPINPSEIPTDAPVETQEAEVTEETPEAKADQMSPNTSPTITPQTAEEAANDTSAITKEIESLAELIADGNYDDAMMQIRALFTKNLTDEQKQTIEDYQKQIEAAR